MPMPAPWEPDFTPLERPVHPETLTSEHPDHEAPGMPATRGALRGMLGPVLVLLLIGAAVATPLALLSASGGPGWLSAAAVVAALTLALCAKLFFGARRLGREAPIRRAKLRAFAAANQFEYFAALPAEASLAEIGTGSTRQSLEVVRTPQGSDPAYELGTHQSVVRGRYGDVATRTSYAAAPLVTGHQLPELALTPRFDLVRADLAEVFHGQPLAMAEIEAPEGEGFLLHAPEATLAQATQFARATLVPRFTGHPEHHLLITRDAITLSADPKVWPAAAAAHTRWAIDTVVGLQRENR